MVLRPPIARGLRFSHRCGSWTEHDKSSNRANVFFHEIAAFRGPETPPLLQKQQIAMLLRQRLCESREGRAAHRASRREAPGRAAAGVAQPRCALSSFRCRPSRPWTRLQRSEHAKTLILAFSQTAQTQNEAICLRQTEQLSAPGMISLPED